VLFPKACYGFAMGLYTPAHIADLQVTLHACIKQALRLHRAPCSRCHASKMG
jgi:hypothetical protein